MTTFENQQSRVENQQFDEKFFNTFADELEETATEPKNNFSDEDYAQINEFRKSRKLSKKNKFFRSLLIRIGQDLRLTPDEIIAMENKFLE